MTGGGILLPQIAVLRNALHARIELHQFFPIDGPGSHEKILGELLRKKIYDLCVRFLKFVVLFLGIVAKRLNDVFVQGFAARDKRPKLLAAVFGIPPSVWFVVFAITAAIYSFNVKSGIARP